ncbi:MAG TPA: helix-turn-helix transcriptional regulator [Planctomycetota bacterium]|nr:helix-turn-helix transcriptional regulator [Planctomycetota bacterium]
MTPRDLESLRRLHEALSLSGKPDGGAIEAALNQACHDGDSTHRSTADKSDALGTRMRSMLAMVAFVKDPLAVVKLDAIAPQLVFASGGAAKLIAAATDHTPQEERVKDFLKGCNRAAASASAETWQARAGEVYRLNCTPIAGDHSDSLVLVRLTPGNPIATTEAELVATALRHGLTPAETRVYVLMARGMSNKEISRQLKISYHTIRAHLRNMFKTLKVSSRVEAIAALRD